MQMEDEENAKISKNYLKEVFQKTKQEENENDRHQERLVVFNEFVSDDMLQRLSNLLMK
jgi:hypothetical protein